MVFEIVADVPAVNVTSEAFRVKDVLIVWALTVAESNPLLFDVVVPVLSTAVEPFHWNVAEAPPNVIVSLVLYEEVLLMVTESAKTYPDTVVDDQVRFNGVSPTYALLTVNVCVPRLIVPSAPVELNLSNGCESNNVGLVTVVFLATLVSVSPDVRKRCGLHSKVILNCPALPAATGETSRPLLYTASLYSPEL